MPSEKLLARPKLLEQTGRGEWTQAKGRPVSLTCPECGGPVAEIPEGSGLRYRCQVGHGYSLQAILVARIQDTERSLWHLASNSMETSSLAELLARQSTREGLPALARKFRTIAEGCRAQLAIFQRMVLALPDGTLSEEVPPKKPRRK